MSTDFLKDTLRKHAYSNIKKTSPPKTEKKSDKNFDNFHISAQNIDCGNSFRPPRRGGSNEYPQSMFVSRNKKNNVYPCKPQFYYIKVGFKGFYVIKAYFRNDLSRGTFPTRLHVRLAKTQISLRSLIRVFAVSLKTLWILDYP